MIGVRLLLLGLLASLLLPALPARAQEDDDREKKLREQLTEDLEEKSPEELRELKKRLKERRAREEVQRKHRAACRIAEHLLKELDPAAAAKVERLSPERRRALDRYVVDRLAETVRSRLMSRLTDGERERLRRVRGHRRMRVLLEMRLRERLTEEEKARLAGLSGPERKKWFDDRLRQAHRAQIDRARKAVLGDVARILDLPPEQLDVELRRPWVVGKLRRAGLERLAPRILRLPLGEIRRRLAELDRLLREPAEGRPAALAAWEAGIPEIPE